MKAPQRHDIRLQPSDFTRPVAHLWHFLTRAAVIFSSLAMKQMTLGFSLQTCVHLYKDTTQTSEDLIAVLAEVSGIKSLIYIFWIKNSIIALLLIDRTAKQDRKPMKIEKAFKIKVLITIINAQTEVLTVKKSYSLAKKKQCKFKSAQKIIWNKCKKWITLYNKLYTIQ